MATTTSRRQSLSPARRAARKSSTAVATVPASVLLRERWQRLLDHPHGEIVVGAGLLGILSVLALPPRAWAALGGGIFGTAAWIVRAPIGAVVIGALLAKRWSDEPELKSVDATD